MMHDEFFGDFSGGTFSFGDSNMNYRWQEATSSDKSNLFRLDCKCYDYPIEVEDWAKILSTSPSINDQMTGFKCNTYRVNSTIVGYYVYWAKPSEVDTLRLLRLGVHPDYRTQGIGTMLIDNAKAKADSFGMMEVDILIPEYYLDPDEDRGINQFVDTAGLMVIEHQQEAFYHYGRSYDGILYRTGGRRKFEYNPC